MKVLFLGNHTVGVRTLHAIREQVELVGVVAHPADPEDGVRYESVFAEATRLGVPVIRAAGKSAALSDFVRDAAPDLIWIADFRYLLPADVLALAPCGAINLHPSLLPAYRGRAPVNWAILRGETQFGLTAHFVDEGMDTGDIVGQCRFQLALHEDVGDALARLYPLYAELTRDVLARSRAGTLARLPQDHSRATAFPRRTPADGEIDWNAPARDVWNLIRAVAAPYPGAFTPWQGGTVRVWKAAREMPAGGVPPGTVLAASDETLLVACGDGALEISKFEVENGVERPIAGTQLGACETAAHLVA